MLESTWQVRSFRRAVLQTVSLDESVLTGLLDVDFWDRDQATAEALRVGVPVDAVQSVASVINFFRLNVGTDPQGAVEELLRLVDATPEEFSEVDVSSSKADILVSLFSQSEDEQRAERTRITQGFIYPTLMNVYSSLELRMEPYSETETELGPFSPVPVVRLEFDEPIGSSPAVVFNLTASSLEQLHLEVTRLELLIERARARFSRDLI